METILNLGKSTSAQRKFISLSYLSYLNRRVNAVA